MRKLLLALVGFGSAIALGSPAQAVIWGLDTCGGVVACPGADNIPTALFRFNENGTGLAVIGHVKNAAGADLLMDGLAISNTGILYGFERSGGSSRLRTINATTAVATTVGATLIGSDIRGATFDQLGRLWAIDDALNQIIRVDPATGILQAATNLTLGGNPFNVSDGTDIAVDAAGQTLMTDGSKGYLLDPSTGALTLAFDHSALFETGSFGPYYVGAAYSGLAPSNELFLMEVNDFDDIYTANGPTYAPGTRTKIIADLESSGVGFNAGRGDLAAEPLAVSLPEPVSLALFGLGLGAIGIARRRRNR